jgi:hypothetical protein
VNSPVSNSRRPSLVPAVIGFAIAGVLILTLGFWTASRRISTRETPLITVLQPAQDTVISGDLTLRFASTIELAIQPAGWGSGRFHIHALVNGAERMPAPVDIQVVGDREYVWTLSALPASAEVQLVWALPDHRRTASGASGAILVRTRPLVE